MDEIEYRGRLSTLGKVFLAGGLATALTPLAPAALLIAGIGGTCYAGIGARHALNSTARREYKAEKAKRGKLEPGVLSKIKNYFTRKSGKKEESPYQAERENAYENKPSEKKQVSSEKKPNPLEVKLKKMDSEIKGLKRNLLTAYDMLQAKDLVQPGDMMKAYDMLKASDLVCNFKKSEPRKQLRSGIEAAVQEADGNTNVSAEDVVYGFNDALDTLGKIAEGKKSGKQVYENDAEVIKSTILNLALISLRYAVGQSPSEEKVSAAPSGNTN
ncbi:hypothetical protein KAR91_81435 [Candidatus Pacearchaeota archaeon]|nr:hypothetical protein [Candidatus Pacearchaeota archaeon]